MNTPRYCDCDNNIESVLGGTLGGLGGDVVGYSTYNSLPTHRTMKSTKTMYLCNPRYLPWRLENFALVEETTDLVRGDGKVRDKKGPK